MRYLVKYETDDGKHCELEIHSDRSAEDAVAVVVLYLKSEKIKHKPIGPAIELEEGR